MKVGRRWLRMSLLVVCVGVAAFGGAQKKAPVVAPTPPMGWNSWDAFGLTITEAQFRDNVAVLSDKLKPFGWNYAVIDEGWFLKNPEERPHPEKLAYQIDDFGRYIPVPSRFPSSEGNGSFAKLGEYVHAQGLKFGIHIVRGIPRESVAHDLPIEGTQYTAKDVADQTDACPWDPTNWGVKDDAAGQAWYDSLLKQYAGWGVDYLKVDCIADHPYKVSEIRMIHRAIEKTGRPMVLSLSPGPTQLEHAKEVGELSQMWRISDDFWDYWTNPKHFPQGLKAQFDNIAAWQPYVKTGNWPDADMLPLGHIGPVPGQDAERDTRFTHDEQRTLLTLWSIARSPLILGANLTRLDDWTLRLLTNRDVLGMDEHGHGQRQALREGDFVVWTSEGKPGQHYLAMFNLGDAPLDVDRSYEAYGLPKKMFKARDLWTGEAVEVGIGPTARAIRATIPPHGCLLLELK